MPFPETQRVIYKNNSLVKVVCQLRFPPILRIESEVPFKFQERIRDAFPEYSEASEIKIKISSDIKNTMLTDEMKDMMQSSKTNNYEFLNDNYKTKVNLTRNFLALTSENYTRWEEFKDLFQIPLNALVDIYAPKVFTRTGLRYINVICKSELGIEDASWDELLRPEVIGLLSAGDIYDKVDVFEYRNEIDLPNIIGKVRLITKFVKKPETDENCFMIDSDFFTNQKLTLDEANNALDDFNLRAGRLIRWVITDRLHNAMEPIEI